MAGRKRGSMTREEAITYGKRVIDLGLNDETQAFCEMAIKALEQEPCEDCISREYAIKQCGFGMTNLLIADSLRRLPPVTPQPKTGHWIPVSERLPEKDTRVLVMVQVGKREPKVRSGFHYEDGFFCIDNGDTWYARDKELKAWMPLPEPYRAESEDKE